jgi:hypothetical protein
MSKSKREIKIKRFKCKLEKAQAYKEALDRKIVEIDNAITQTNSVQVSLGKIVSSATQMQNERFKKLEYARKNSLTMGKMSPSTIDQLAHASLVSREQELMIRSSSRRARKYRYVIQVFSTNKNRMIRDKDSTEKRIQVILSKIRAIESVIKKQQEKAAALTPADVVAKTVIVSPKAEN